VNVNVINCECEWLWSTLLVKFVVFCVLMIWIWFVVVLWDGNILLFWIIVNIGFIDILLFLILVMGLFYESFFLRLCFYEGG